MKIKKVLLDKLITLIDEFLNSGDTLLIKEMNKLTIPYEEQRVENIIIISLVKNIAQLKSYTKEFNNEKVYKILELLNIKIIEKEGD